MKILPVVSASILVLFVIAMVAHAQSTQPRSSPLSHEEEQLNKARRENEEAQAEYYREQTKKLRESSPTPTPAKSIRQGIAENPASVVGVVGAVVAALFAAMVGLLTLYVNHRAFINAQRDAQFYEALKRFGDKDSPITRNSATGILTQLAKYKARKINLLHPISTLRNYERPYFDTTLDQLIVGSMLEDKESGLVRINEAIGELARIDAIKSLVMLTNTNVTLQDDLIIAIVDFFAVNRVESLDPIPDNTLQMTASMTHFVAEEIRFLMKSKPRMIGGLLKSKLAVFSEMPAESKTEYYSTIQKNLWLASVRLFLHISGYSYTLKNIAVAPDYLTRYTDRIFLVRVNLEHFRLIGFDLRRFNLSRARLKGANLSRAKMQGTWAPKANIDGAILAGTEVNESTNFEGVNWWKANFFIQEEKGIIDTDLLEYFYRRYPQDIPESLDEIHPSVRNFIANKRKS